VNPSDLSVTNRALIFRGAYNASIPTWIELSFGVRWIVDAGGFLRVYFYATTAVDAEYIDVAGALSVGTWTHIAVVRNGSNGEVFVDGVSSGTITGLHDTLATGSRAVFIGTAELSPSTGEWFSGHIDDVLVTKNVAKYSANFAPPTAAFVIDDALITSTPDSIGNITSDLCLRAGLTAGQIDVTGLSTITRTVRGMALAQIAPTRQALELLMSTYFFEMVTSDKIYFRPRGAASVASIPYLDLGASTGDEPSEPLALRQANELEIPAQIALSYINASDDYQTDTQYSDRLVSAAAGTLATLQMAICMTPAEAKAVADTMLLDQAASVVSTQLALLGDYCRLEPTDAVTVSDADGSTFRLRLVKKTDAYPLLTFDAVLDDTSVLTSQGITSTDYTSSTVVAAAVGALIELMDIPILQDADDDAGFYVAAKGDGTPYPGAAVYNSPDDVTYALDATVSESAVFGTCSTTLGDWTGPRVFDELNSVTVDVGDGTLASSTRDAVLASIAVNAMLIGSELIQFVTATLVSTGVYTLSRLLRGGRGTEWAMVDHAASERCVLLRAAGLRRIVRTTSELGTARYYKGVTLGQALSSATAELFTDNAVGLKPFSPFDLRAQIRADTGEISWDDIVLPVHQIWTDIAWNGTVFCAVAYGSNIVATSPDGIVWTQHTMPFAEGAWWAIAWNGTVFCTVAYGTSRAATSPDGETWTERTLPASAEWGAICAKGATFCAISIGSDSTGTDVAATSADDGENWTARTLPSTSFWRAIASDGTQFCAIAGRTTPYGALPNGCDIAATSPDGITWTPRTLPSDLGWTGIAWNGSVFCAVASGWSSGVSAATSADGATWTIQSLASYDWVDVAWNGTEFCALALGNVTATSADGVVWVTANDGFTRTHGWSAIATNNDVFCAIGVGHINDTIQAKTTQSPGGITLTWQRRTRLDVRTTGALGISVPLGEDSESYEVDIYADGTYAAVLRTISATSATCAYSAAEQTADGLTPGDTVYARVYQRSAIVGRGYALEQAA
jgi:hypothetical protein